MFPAVPAPSSSEGVVLSSFPSHACLYTHRGPSNLQSAWHPSISLSPPNHTRQFHLQPCPYFAFAPMEIQISFPYTTYFPPTCVSRSQVFALFAYKIGTSPPSLPHHPTLLPRARALTPTNPCTHTDTRAHTISHSLVPQQSALSYIFFYFLYHGSEEFVLPYLGCAHCS